MNALKEGTLFLREQGILCQAGHDNVSLCIPQKALSP